MIEKVKADFTVLSVSEFIKEIYLYSDPFSVVWFAKNGKAKKSYVEIYAGFDIETFTVPGDHYAYMWIWQFSFYTKNGNYIIIGRTWDEFVKMIDAIKKILHLSAERRLLIGVANLSYEHQFLKCHFPFRWSKTFAKEKRQPLLAVLDDCIEFRDILAITGGSLATLAKEYTKTQKMAGDLDYSVPRTYADDLFSITTKTERMYCYTDVAIVAEFMQYLFNTYIIPEHYIPMTKTGLLRRKVKKKIREKGNGHKFAIMREIYRCFPASKSFYDWMMQYCFRGGYVHGNVRYADRVVNVRSFDITSSYPYTMLAYDGFPVSPFREENPADFWDLYNGGKHCLMMQIIFTNLRAKTDHAIESKSKCISISRNALIDNGRIRRCAQCNVVLTELDFTCYELYYAWDSMKIERVYSAVKGRLPKYLLEPLAEAYEQKAKMKHDGKSGTTEYALYKSLVNSAYGMSVTRMVEAEVCMMPKSGEWFINDSGFDYEKERKKAFLLPQWGVYICAYSRFRILSAIYALGSDAVYSDTDSIKFVGDHNDYFEYVNKKTRETMSSVCKRYNLDYNLFYDLGSFEAEYDGEEVQSKFLGAKRYLIKHDDKYEVTVAGLPKKALTGYFNRLKIQHEIFDYGKYPLDLFEIFRNKMLMDSEVSLKNAHCYNDEPHSSIINGTVCIEQASVGIYGIDFTMKLSDFYVALILAEKERNKIYENRIY